MIAPLPGGTPGIFPIPYDLMMNLRGDGINVAKSLGLRADEIDDKEFIGAATRADGSPFYIWITAPDLQTGQDKPWRGAFFAPFGVGEIQGLLEAVPGDKKDTFAISALDVTAKLVVEGNTEAEASWQVIGSQHSRPNKAALIRGIKVINSGPHDSDDIRRCIALHAPQVALGEPRALVSMQCGVAVSALIEAIC
ncbi:hypothetical protein [Hoeflea sp. TYP-13]|uniref:hypothetical protein n=1 Tax=Hoeflea sp. TYP-13 TaxID=3230023 RepID=UPI0034C6B543